MPTLKKIELTSFSDQKVTIGRAAFHREKVQPFPQSHLLYISEKHCVVEKNPFIPQDFIIQGITYVLYIFIIQIIILVYILRDGYHIQTAAPSNLFG